MFWILFAFLVLSGAMIVYQDLTARLISLWLILLFGAANILFYLSASSAYSLLENTIFCLCYLLFSYGILLLYFYVKHKKFDRIIDTQFGWGDVLVMLFIGITLDPVTLIYFFSAALIISLVFGLLFFRSKQGIPLAGLLVINYVVLVMMRMILQYYPTT